MDTTRNTSLHSLIRGKSRLSRCPPLNAVATDRWRSQSFPVKRPIQHLLQYIDIRVIHRSRLPALLLSRSIGWCTWTSFVSWVEVLGSTRHWQGLACLCDWDHMKRASGNGEELDIPNGLIKDALQVPLRQSRTLEVLDGTDLLGANQSLVVRYGLHSL